MRERALRFSAPTWALVAVAAVAAAGLAGAARGTGPDDAVAYQVDAAHDGVQTDASLAPPFVRRWKVSLPASVSYPLIAQGLVFVTAGDNGTGSSTLYALDQTTGATVWSQPLQFFRPWSNGAYDAGKVFVVGNDACICRGLLKAYDAASGALLWTTPLPGQYMFTSPPTAANGVVYAGGAGSGGTVYSVDEASGALLATASVMNGDHSSPAVTPNGVSVSYACNQAYDFAPSTLRLLWHYSTGCEGGGGKTVVYSAGRVFTRDFDGNLILDASTGTLLGSYAATPAPAVSGNTMWALSGSGLSALDLSTPSSPKTLWSFTGDGSLDTAPIVVDTGSGRLVVEGSAGGMLYALDAGTGGARWSANVGAAIAAPDEQNVSQPLTGLAAGDGLLVVPAGDTVAAYGRDLTAPTITVPSTITARATSANGAAVTYTVAATDPDDTATVACTPSSGSTFAVGVTTVSCTATDTAGNSSSASFLVVVSSQTPDCNLTHYRVVKGALDVHAADLSGCYLPGSALAGANAAGTNFHGAFLDGSKLGKAGLSSANLTAAYIRNVDFTGSDLSRANLTGAATAGSIFTRVKWLQTICVDGTSSNADGGTCVGHL